MSGYVPVFDSVYHGTLCGKWPTLPVWLTILPMADKNGHIDMSFAAISALTGWPMDLLRQAIDELMQPDPSSRSNTSDGRRLELLDPENRDWGWRVVNHAKYREKARLVSKNAQEVSAGRNRQRMNDRRRPPETADDPRSPPETPSQTQTQTQTHTDTSLRSVSTRARAESPSEPPSEAEEGSVPAFDGWEFVERHLKAVYPAGTFRHNHWLLAARAVERLVEAGANPDDIVENAQAYARQQEAMGNTGTQYVLAPSKWLADETWRGPFPMPAAPRRQRDETAMQRIQRLNGGAPVGGDETAIPGEAMEVGDE